MFTLDARLVADTRSLGRLGLCRVLLMNNRVWPWLILVPERDQVTEIYQLSADDQGLLMAEAAAVSAVLVREFAPHKLNVATIGNIVPQLHLHIVARWRHDPVWPRPVWGAGVGEPYPEDQLANLTTRLGCCLKVVPVAEKPVAGG